MDLAELERRITRIEDIEAIKQLKARYCEICDDDHDPSSLADEDDSGTTRYLWLGFLIFALLLESLVTGDSEPDPVPESLSAVRVERSVSVVPVELIFRVG